jgi:predicted flavoprotein YhiN
MYHFCFIPILFCKLILQYLLVCLFYQYLQIIKNIPMDVKGLLGIDKAIVTSGGVKLDEIDFKTMQSRLFSNLYLVGDVLNIDRPSGGYSLQLCWTTGFVAGDSVEK